MYETGVFNTRIFGTGSARLGCKSCKKSNTKTFSPELGSASQRRGRNARKIHKLEFPKFA